MKKLSLSYLILMMGLAMFLATSCDPDPGPGTGGTGGDAPFVNLLDGTDITSTDITVEPGAEFTVRVEALVGSANLKTLTILEDGFTLDGSRITAFAGTDAPASNSMVNPATTLLSAAEGFTWDVTITAHTDVAAVLYEFEVEDVDGLTTTQSITVTTEESSEPLSLTYNGASSVDVTEGQLLSLNLDITAGMGQLATIGVRENDILITDLTRLRYKDAGEFTANPQDFLDEDKDGFMGNITVRAAAGVNNITIEVTNDAGESENVTVTFNAAPAGTPISTTISGVLLNAGGPVNTGGLDLDEGNGDIGSMAPDAEIKDEGIDQSLPDASNWKMNISAANNAELRKVDFTQVEGFTFDAVTTIEEIANAFNTGVVLTTSGVVVEGDLYVVRRDGKDYLIRTDEVNNIEADNSDNYVFSIKH